MSRREARDPAGCFVDVLRICAGEPAPHPDAAVRKLVSIATSPPADLTLSSTGIEVRFASDGRAHRYHPELGPGLIGALLEGRRPPCRFHVGPGALDRVSLRACPDPLWIGVELSEDAVRISVRLADTDGEMPTRTSPLPELPQRSGFLLFPHEVVCPHCGRASQRARHLGGTVVVCGACGRSRTLDEALVAVAVVEG